MAAERGLILVDTKYEFGKKDGKIFLIDEIHTPDSSRYFYQVSKEFVREWLMANGFQGKEGQQMPEMPDEFVETVSERYIQLYEILTGNKFEKADAKNIQTRIEQNIVDYLS